MKQFLFGALLASAMIVPAHAEIRATEAYAFATPKTGKAGAAYVIVEGGETADRLVGAASDVAQRVELHEHQMTDGVMRMREVEAGIELPAKGQIVMEPGGYHIMLMGLNGQLEAGQSFPVTLTFESGADLSIDVVVKNRGEEGHNGHGSHGDHNMEGAADAHSGDGDHSGHKQKTE
ncbi:MAG: copper chaperone PCu(A)C [Pseudomonadota bacterium]